MPLFEYTCRGCGAFFEILVRHDTVPTCPTCQSQDLEKALSLFAVDSEGTRKANLAAGRALTFTGSASVLGNFTNNGAVSGTGGAWHTSPALPVKGLYFAGYGPQDANPDLGDSAITETAASAATGITIGVSFESLATRGQVRSVNCMRQAPHRWASKSGEAMIITRRGKVRQDFTL